MTKPNKASVAIVVIAVVALLGMAAGFFAPKLFNGDSRRANQSQEATAHLDKAQQNKEGNVAASVTAIGQANADAPDSKEKEFIGKEVPLILSQLSPPDAQKLFEATARRAAVAEGNLALTNKLYGQATKDAMELTRELAQAKEERKQVDLAISEAAAYKLGAERTKMALGIVIAVLVAIAAYLKIYGISTSNMGKIAADVRAGVSPITAIDTHLAPWLHSSVNKHSRLNTPTTQ